MTMPKHSFITALVVLLRFVVVNGVNVGEVEVFNDSFEEDFGNWVPSSPSLVKPRARRRNNINRATHGTWSVLLRPLSAMTASFPTSGLRGFRVAFNSVARMDLPYSSGTLVLEQSPDGRYDSWVKAREWYFSEDEGTSLGGNWILFNNNTFLLNHFGSLPFGVNGTLFLRFHLEGIPFKDRLWMDEVVVAGLPETPAPTSSPTQSPTSFPTSNPTGVPTKSPTDSPTKSPTDSPTKSPTDVPTMAPTLSPTTGTPTMECGCEDDALRREFCRRNDCAPLMKKVFVSSVGYLPTEIASASNADSLCQGLANNANLRGTYMAWLSDESPNSSPSERFTNKNPFGYVLVDGTTIVADSWEDLTDGTVQNWIGKDQNGKPQGNFVWTGTTTAGTKGPTTCENWSSNVNGVGRAGHSSQNSSPQWWSERGNDSCSFRNLIYCFEQ